MQKICLIEDEKSLSEMIRLNLEMTNCFYVDDKGRLLFAYDENDKEWELY